MSFIIVDPCGELVFVFVGIIVHGMPTYLSYSHTIAIRQLSIPQLKYLPLTFYLPPPSLSLSPILVYVSSVSVGESKLETS